MHKFLLLLFCISSALATVKIALNCPDGWQWFTRSRGGWCMKVYSGTMTFADADAKCKALNATIAGVQNAEERSWMSDEMKTLQPGADIMWIGLKRTNACMNSGITKTCSSISSFYWTDGSVVGVSGFKWNPGEPNNMGGHQDCAVLSTKLQSMDDMGCTELKTAGYACGKIATF